MYSLSPKKSSLALEAFCLVLLIWLLTLKMQTLLSRESPNCIQTMALTLQSSPPQCLGLHPCGVDVEPCLRSGHRDWTTFVMWQLLSSTKPHQHSALLPSESCRELILGLKSVTKVNTAMCPEWESLFLNRFKKQIHSSGGSRVKRTLRVILGYEKTKPLLCCQFFQCAVLCLPLLAALPEPLSFSCIRGSQGWLWPVQALQQLAAPGMELSILKAALTVSQSCKWHARAQVWSFITFISLKQFNLKKWVVWALRQLQFSTRLLIIQDYAAWHWNPSDEA